MARTFIQCFQLVGRGPMTRALPADVKPAALRSSPPPFWEGGGPEFAPSLGYRFWDEAFWVWSGFLKE